MSLREEIGMRLNTCCRGPLVHWSVGLPDFKGCVNCLKEVVGIAVKVQTEV